MRRDDSMTKFSRALREWTRRPPERSAGEARARVQSALAPQQPATPWHRRLALAAALVLVFLALGISVLDEPSSDQPQDEEAVAEAEAQRFLVVTLASGNRLYIQISPPTSRSPRP